MCYRMVQQAAKALTAQVVVIYNLFLNTRLCLFISPPAYDGAALVLVPADIGGAHELVANV